ncbi:MAG: EamA family transporter [Bacteroidales bacterium]|jgi:undecaprenyl phosphate-alpha-L-ara4N flippase subunit ArnE|nr:EamA family transporter [Bacteroidales bacterium]
MEIVQTLLLAISQTSVKVAMGRTGEFCWKWSYFKNMLINWPMACAATSAIIAMIMWFYILKHWELSIAYPLQSLAYIWGMLAAALFLRETIVPTRWVGVLLIMAGVVFMVIK